MIAFRIISTVLIGISYFSCFIKNWTMVCYGEERYDNPNFKNFIYLMIWGVMWRTFVIVSVWLI